MSRFTHKFSTPIFGAASRVVMLALFLVVFGVSTALNTATAMDDQVPFTGSATAIVTRVTKLPGGLTQINLNITGNATHIGDLTGSSTRIQDLTCFSSSRMVNSRLKRNRC